MTHVAPFGDLPELSSPVHLLCFPALSTFSCHQEKKGITRNVARALMAGSENIADRGYSKMNQSW